MRLPAQVLARQPRLQILKHDLIRRIPFQPPALIHSDQPHSALLPACVPGSAAALLISRRNLIFQQPASILNNLARLIQLV